MPFSVKIPILNNTDCTTALIVEYKKSTETDWLRLPPQPSVDYIMINDWTIARFTMSVQRNNVVMGNLVQMQP